MGLLVLETGDAKGMIRLAEQEGLRAQQKGVKIVSNRKISAANGEV